jgi:hypothetical protein
MSSINYEKIKESNPKKVASPPISGVVTGVGWILANIIPHKNKKSIHKGHKESEEGQRK